MKQMFVQWNNKQITTAIDQNVDLNIYDIYVYTIYHNDIYHNDIQIKKLMGQLCWCLRHELFL
jgi:hypothetical protein